MRTCVSRVVSLRVDGVEARELSVGRDAVDAFIVDAASNVVAEQREDRQQARQQLGERVVERAPQRGHDRRPRARAGAAERVFTILRVVFMIRLLRRCGRRVHLDGVGLCLLAKRKMGGQPRRALLRRGRGPAGESLAQRFLHACAARAAFGVCNSPCVRCDVPSARLVEGAGWGEEASGEAWEGTFR